MTNHTYLDSEITEKEDSVEKFFCEKFSTLKTQPLTQEISKFLISLLFIDDNDSQIVELKNNMLNPQHKELSSGIAIILQKRFCEQYNFSFENRLLILLSQLIDSPGKAVMYGTYFAYWAKKNNTKKITLDHFCVSVFPWGLPTEEETSKIWREQKVKRKEGGSDNLLDYPCATISLIQN